MPHDELPCTNWRRGKQESRRQGVKDPRSQGEKRERERGRACEVRAAPPCLRQRVDGLARLVEVGPVDLRLERDLSPTDRSIMCRNVVTVGRVSVTGSSATSRS